MRQRLSIVMSLWALPLTAVGAIVGAFVWSYSRVARKAVCNISVARLGNATAIVLHGNACVVAFRVLVPWMVLDGIHLDRSF
jgi:hypothetical protein